MRKSFGLALAVLVACAAAARAEPLDLRQVSADAKWAAHLDVDALQASSMFQKARACLLAKHPGAEAHLAMLHAMWKFNPQEDLHGITIYGTQLKKDTGVAIVYAKVDQDFLLEKAKLAPEHRTSSYGKYELHSWSHAKGSKHERTMAGTFYQPEVMVFGASAEEVMAALDVLDGTKPNFADKELATGASVRPGTILVAGVVGLAEANLPCKSPLAKQAESLVMMAGEDQGNVFVGGWLMMKQADQAEQIKTVMDGALAMARLLHDNDAEANELVDAVKVAATGNSVSVKWQASVDTVWEHIQKVAAKKPWRKHHHGWPSGH